MNQDYSVKLISSKSHDIKIPTVDKNLSINNLDLIDISNNYNTSEYETIDYNQKINLEDAEYDYETLLKEASEDVVKERKRIEEEAIKKVQEYLNSLNDLGNIDLNSKEKIDNLKDRYNNLTDYEKRFLDNEAVTNVLNNAEAIYKELRAAEDARIAEEKRKAEEEKRRQEEEANKPFWEKAWDFACDCGANVVTFCASAIEGAVDVVESAVDGVVQVVGGAVAYGVGLIDEDAGKAMKKGIQDFVSYDASGAMYDAWVDFSGIDPEIAYGFAHTAGNFVGQTVTYAAISAIPGGVAVTSTIGGFTAAGSAADRAYANGATFDEAMISSVAAGALGGAAGAGSNLLGTAAKGATTLSGALGYTGAGAAVGAAEPLLNSAVEYATYGNNDGKSYWEFMNDSGGWLGVATGAAAGGMSTGSQAFGGYKNTPKNKLKKGIDIEPRQKTKVQIGGKDIETNLTKDELIKFANDFYNLEPPITSLDDYPNYGVIEDVSSIKLEDGMITVDWVENQGAVAGTRKSTNIKAGSEIDRYGKPNGNYFAKMEVDADGNFIGIEYDKRSLPYTEGSQKYTKLKVVKDINSDSLSDAMTKLKKSDPDFYKEITIKMKKDGFKYTELPDGKVKIDVNEATIAPGYGHGGGGTQFELPIKSDYLKDPRLGFLK